MPTINALFKGGTQGFGARGIKTVLIKPGINEVTSEQLEFLKIHPEFCFYLDSGRIEILEDMKDTPDMTINTPDTKAFKKSAKQIEAAAEAQE